MSVILPLLTINNVIGSTGTVLKGGIQEMSQIPKTNYQLILDKTIKQLSESGKRPTLLLHACCAPCSSYVLEYLTSYFDITVFFYNPNISPEEEYLHRVSEIKRLIDRKSVV